MRNVFDQYVQPENRLTHALLGSLDADRRLLRDFLKSFVGVGFPARYLTVLEQSLPGESQTLSHEEVEKRGLPDGWIYDETGWALLIESKVAATPNAEQIRRHVRTARNRGATDILVLWITVVPVRGRISADVRNRTWAELYEWLSHKGRNSEWAARAAQYFEIAEVQADMKEHIRTGTLTKFTGIPFDDNHLYTYIQAKRVLGLLRDRLADRKDLVRQLGSDPSHPGRGAITGRALNSVWDFVALRKLAGGRSFTKHPHLTLGIHSDQLHASLTIPDKVGSRVRNNLLGAEYGHFAALVQETTERLIDALRGIEGWRPEIVVVQRRYRSQKSIPVLDANIRLDPRTAFPLTGRTGRKGRGRIKSQPQWLRAVYEALKVRKSNLQFQIGAAFPYDTCSTVRHASIEDAVAKTWIACKPIIDAAKQ